MKKRLLAAGFVVVSLVLPQKALAANFSQLYVFGDSLSDTGNVFNATGGTFPASPPYFNGRFSNGPLWLEYFGNQLGLNPALITDLNNGNPSQGINFAFGGSSSGLGNAVVRDAPLPGVLGQVGVFAQSLLANNQTADPNALYVVWGGANDFLFPNPDDSSIPVNNITQALSTLVSVGARNLLVFNLPDLGKLPGATVDNRVPASLTQSSNNFNFGLQATVAAFSQNPNLNVIPVDVNSLFNRAIASPAQFGFNNVTDSCLSRFDICRNDQTKFLFWDDFHPTTTAHQFIADTALAAIQAQEVPESSTTLGLLALGVVGGVGIRKRQQKKLAVTPANPVLDAQLSRIKVES
ncbi:SGNH/GDSL hydrolase family protein [Nostoc sp. FACHB-87]|uniref:SGNH/GDSL hydrolase family protein n=1 Tax=Nostocaceae TaxID=1162 RepID=UPI00168317B6|nr:MULTISPECIES: SGNH/GDSL hydrolase family protein [Nostocaceae]MBD2456969.1 SGNH/GDSL hydrolase family protein [Nostoc sp. FACHB-87]MBD2479976.1 SGNH/GDSL hydrolase family protein [Anabaena sp. FACHB-83]